MFYLVQSPAPEVPNVDSLQTFRAEFPQLTPDEILRVRDLNNELGQDGFAEPVCYLIEPTSGGRRLAARIGRVVRQRSAVCAEHATQRRGDHHLCFGVRR